MTTKQFLSDLQVIESQVRCYAPKMTAGGALLSKADSQLWGDALTVMYAVWSESLGGLHPGIIKRHLDILLELDILDFMAVLKEADFLLFKQSTNHDPEWESYEDFKHLLHSQNKRAGAVIGPLKPLIQSVICGDIGGAIALRSCFLICERVTLHDVPNLEEEAWDKLLAVYHDLDQLPDDVGLDLADIIAEWFPVINWDCYRPHHSNGSTAEKAKTWGEKYLFTNTPLVRMFDKVSGRRPLPDCIPKINSNYFARQTFVPKGIDRYRGVCCEPVHLQYIEQGIRGMFDFQRHPVLKYRINLQDATINRHLAYEGSYSRELATIDQSSASDYVANKLVINAFSKSPLGPILQHARSKYVLYKDSSGYVHKELNRSFAPMGSGLCFPIECIIFAAICEKVVRLHRYYKSRYHVYGDDIVIESLLAELLMQELRAHGFKVNADKSFWGIGPFRESCGGEYFDGVDVTPLRLSRKFKGKPVLKAGRVDCSQMLAWIDLVNRCYTLFPKTRSYLLRSIMDLPARVRPIFTDKLPDFHSWEPVTSWIYSDNATNYDRQARDLVKSLNPSYCPEGRTWTYQYQGGLPKQSNEQNLHLEELRYYVWLDQAEQRTSEITDEVLKLQVDTGSLHWKGGWILP